MEYDTYCKKVLSHKWLIAQIFKEYVEEYKECSLNEIIKCITELQMDVKDEGNYVETRNVEDSIYGFQPIFYDILLYARLPKSKDLVGMIINLEAQGVKPSYPILKRAFYYLSRLISRQKGHPYGFKNSEYGNIKKVVGIWIYNEPKFEGVINIYSVKEEVLAEEVRFEKEDYDLMQAVIIGPNETVKGENQVMDILSLLFGTKGNVTEDTLYRLEKEYGIVLVEKERQEIEQMCNWSEYRLRQGREMGIQEGIQKGMQEGMQKGEKRGIEETIKVITLMQQGNSAEEIIKQVSLSYEEVKGIVDKMAYINVHSVPSSVA